MKIAIIGSGLVGATTAYSLVTEGVGRQVVLIDMNRERANAEAEDIRHAVPFTNPLEVMAGDYQDLTGARLVILAAGAGQTPGEDRIAPLRRNAEIFAEIVPRALQYAPDAVLLVATNPVDVMTHLTVQYAASCGVPSQRVIGSGTSLDSARFRALLGRHIGVDAHHVHGYVIGEHGDSEVLAWSRVTVAGMPLKHFCHQQQVRMDELVRDRIEGQVRQVAYRILEGKGATYYGIASALTRIARIVLHDERAIMTVCTAKQDVAGVNDVTLSLPHLFGGPGIISTLPLPLVPDERQKLAASAQKIRGIIDLLD